MSASPAASTALDLEPDARSARRRARGRSAPAGRSTYSRSQRQSGTTAGTQPSIPNGQGEAHVALDDVAHVGDVVAEHQRALDAHAEREAAVALGVDAAGDAAPAG